MVLTVSWCVMKYTLSNLSAGTAQCQVLETPSRASESLSLQHSQLAIIR